RLPRKGDVHSFARGGLIGGRSMKSITIDHSKRLAEEPGKGHNRWHEAIVPVIEAAPGEEVEIQTRDAFDGQISEATTGEDPRRRDLNRVHALLAMTDVLSSAAGPGSRPTRSAVLRSI